MSPSPAGGRRGARLVRVVALACALAAAARAGEAQDAAPDDRGLRDSLARRGLTFGLRLQADHSTVLSGGLGRSSVLRRPLALTLDVDGARLLGWNGARLHVGLQLHRGRHGAELVDDAQGFDNVDAEPFQQLSELWLEQELLSGRARIKVGKTDANADFAGVTLAGGFLSSSAGFSPTIAGFPSYPDPATGAALFLRPHRRLSLGAGLYDGATLPGCHGRTGNRGVGTLWGAPAALFLVGEAGARLALGARPLRIAAGTWRHTAATPDPAGGARQPASGSYLVVERGLVATAPSGGDLRMGLFAQVGLADGGASEVDRHLSLGFAWAGPWGRRPADSLGLLVSSVRLGSAAGSARRGRHETALEAFYDFRLRPWLGLKPDLQYIIDPGGRAGRGALVATVRASIEL